MHTAHIKNIFTVFFRELIFAHLLVHLFFFLDDVIVATHPDDTTTGSANKKFLSIIEVEQRFFLNDST